MTHQPAECGRAAFDSVVRLGITPTPDNFAIWYEYHSGLNPELRHLIDLLLRSPGQCDDQTMRAVHRRFFAHQRERQALREASERMQALLQEVGTAVGDAGQEARSFGAAVRETSGAFVAGTTPLPLLIQRLREEAQGMAERSDMLGQHLAGAAERIQTLERSLDDLRHDAATDGLTGLNNRRSFDTRLREAAGQAMNSGEPLTLVLIDIDHFKRVNDQWGHQTGDQVLRLVAATLNAGRRAEDFVARYGGEEFALILPATSAAAAAEIANRMRRGFEGRPIVARNSGTSIGSVTISAGGASYDPGERLSDWVERADKALYAAKQGGRNRVCMAGVAENPPRIASDRPAVTAA
ncbi:MAG: GGDEF domain-containing protein [Acetobacteraceae bacterium]|nr:GGDEF domain-containing protein [Acetobacteraceae bacterium]